MRQNGETLSGLLSTPPSVSNLAEIKNVASLKNAVTPIKLQDDEDPSLAWKQDGNTYDKGPDQLLPSSATYTWHVDGAVKLSKLGKGSISEEQPVSVPSLLAACAHRAPERMALAVKRNGNWQTWTYRKYREDVRTVAKAFISLGLEPFHSVCILGFNAPEWFISNMAAIHAGGFATGIYTTNSAEACAFVIKDSKAQIVVVEDNDQLEKILRYKNDLLSVKAIIQYTGKPSDPNVLSWSKLMSLGEQQTDLLLNERLVRIAINQCCTLIYTSGTTGNPKGVMLSHDNLTWSAKINSVMSNAKDCKEQYVSFLPLSHVAAQMVDMYCSLVVAASVYFADRNAFKGSLIETMKEVEPTIFFAVPRVWEKMYEKMQEVGKTVHFPKRLIANWAKCKGTEYHMKRADRVDNSESLGFKIARKLVLSKVRSALGLAKCHAPMSGGAPLKPEILRYFMSLNIVVTEVYGMSECSGAHSFGQAVDVRIGSVGKTIPGCSTKIVKSPGGKEGANGEICLGGRHVLMGYLGQPDMTTGAIDEDGWLFSGDIGKLDKDGYLYITGRIKELVITAGGENVAPVPIENTVKEAHPVVSQAMVVGDNRKYLSILLTLKTEVDMDSLKPLDILQASTKEWINSHGNCHASTVTDVLKELYEKNNTKLVSAFQSEIDHVNAKAVSHAQRIQKWHLLPVDFSIPGGEFGPTLKLKRSAVLEKYKDIIADLY